jgi:nucleotidyltransferase substrate binding protein (TIGR01987 family)
MELMEKFNALQDAFERAVIDLDKVLAADFSAYDELETDWIKNAQIQKFEVCTELMWKTAKVYLAINGVEELTPKRVVKALLINRVISEEIYLDLMDCLNDRNILSHVYKSESFELIQKQLPNHSIALTRLVQALKTNPPDASLSV